VVSGDRQFILESRKLEILLAALLVRVGYVVSVDQLIAELWGEEPPLRADAGLYVFMSRLRKFLVCAGDPERAIATKAPGYQFRRGTAEFDFELLQEEMSLGRERLRQGSAQEACAALESALALHRGPVVTGPQGSPILRTFAVWAEESRLECHEMLIEAKLALGQHREVVGLLYRLIAEHPLREAFYQNLMVALYRSGRQADALRVYQQAREAIVREIGVEPCRSLRELHQAVLLEDSAIDALVIA